MVDGKLKQLLVHRKGSTRAFPPHHPLIPVDYQFIGQPVLIGGTMGFDLFHKKFTFVEPVAMFSQGLTRE